MALAFFSVFAWSILHVHNGGTRLGVFTGVLQEFSLFPTLVISTFRELDEPERFLFYDPIFQSTNNLEYDIFALNASFDSSKWIIRLVNLRNDSTIYKWHLDEDKYFNTGRAFSHAEPRLPILLKDTSLILHNDESRNLFRLDANSKVLWHSSEYRFHHAINLDSDGNIWTCTLDLEHSTSHDNQYQDNYLTQVDSHNGKVLYHKSLTKILFENDLSYLIHGYTNDIMRMGIDPLHLNDIEPVLQDGTYWNEGDLFISLRNRSMILLYRPSTNKIIRIIQGPFFNQHDIDILSDSTISMFNNNVTSLEETSFKTDDNSEYLLLPNSSLNVSAEVLVYNLIDSSFSSLYPDQFVEHQIFTRTQGLHHILPNGDLFVESYSEGKVFIFNERSTLLKKYVNRPANGFVEPPHWMRIYNNLNILN